MRYTRLGALLTPLLLACAEQAIDRQPTRDSAREAFARVVDSLLMDTERHEFRATLMVKIPNPNRDDESPLVDRDVSHPATPGPHTLNGTLYAEVGALRDLLGREIPVEIDTARHFVYVGANPEVLMIGHPHGGAWYVPVKLFARQYGAYVDIGCTLANCAFIWPRPVIDHMKSIGAVGGSGILEGHAEGIVSGVNVRKLPTG